MPDEQIDWEAVVAEFQRENEILRGQIAHDLLNPPKWWQQFSVRDAKDILEDNYFWLGVAAGAIIAIAYGLVPRRFLFQ